MKLVTRAVGRNANGKIFRISALSRIPPNALLARWVECGWLMRSATAVTAHRVPPDGCLDIIYDRGRGVRAIGTMAKEQRFHFPDGVWVTGVRFRPGMAVPFLGVSPAELTDVSAPLEELWAHRAGELRRRLDGAKSIQDAMRILLGPLPAPHGTPNSVQRAIEGLAAADGNADLDRARNANLSPRHFRGRCLEESDLTPKRLCRVLRFRKACRIAGTIDRPNWSAIALEAAYFDQAHLIRDFHEFTGLTPMAVFSNNCRPPRRRDRPRWRYRQTRLVSPSRFLRTWAFRPSACLNVIQLAELKPCINEAPTASDDQNWGTRHLIF